MATPHDYRELTRAAAVELGFDRCGIAAAGPIPRAGFLAEWLAAGYAGSMAYLHRHQDSRIDVRAWLPWARSVIVVALNYRQEPENAETPKCRNAETLKGRDAEASSRASNTTCGTGVSPVCNQAVTGQGLRPQGVVLDTLSNDERDSRVAEGPQPPGSPSAGVASPHSPSSILHSSFAAPPRRGRVAMYAWGEDYHVVMRERLEALVVRMREIIGERFQARACVDTSAILEREHAAAAGIGWIGKNTMVLHPSLGSFFFLGEIITDLVLPPDRPEPDRCGTCTRCLDACPTAAFPRPYVMDARRCISYLTIEHRGEIDSALAAKMGDWVFGCDVCQGVCPYNRRAPAGIEPRFQGTLDDARPLLDDLLSWDAAAHQAQTRGQATRRAKSAMWRRNAEIVKRNTTAG